MQAYETLEKNLEQWCGLPTAVCSTGTAALHLALEALRLPLGSKVIVPEYTFVACARAVSMAGLTPVFVDVKSDDLTLDPELVKRACDQWEIRAIMAVHAYGRRCDMDALISIADAQDCFMIEDLAEAHGIPVHPSTDAACWSFYRNKIIAGEEGGAVASRLADVIERVKCLRSQGYRPGEFWNHEPRGVNARMTNAQASKILVSLMNFPQSRSDRETIEGWNNAECPKAWRMENRDVLWLYDFRIKGFSNSTQREIVTRLNQAGIYARPGFRPLSSMDEYNEKCEKLVERERYASEAEWGWREVIGLECSPGVTTKDKVRRAWEIIRSVVPTPA